MTEEYFKKTGLNYSTLADFHRSQDHALKPHEPKSYFEIGTALETTLQDVAQGTSLYFDRYFNSDSPGSIPEKIVGWIDAGEDLTEKYQYNKDGSKSKKYSRIHSWLDDCLKHPGKIPMGVADQDLIGRMLNSLLKLEIEGVPFAEVLPDCMFQVPLYWTMQGVEKKALLDIVYQTADQTYIWDLKTTANFKQFKSMFFNRYWVQFVHYTEGARMFFQGVRPMNFIVASKAEDDLFYAKEYERDVGGDGEKFNAHYEDYQELVKNYVKWVEAGKPIKGFMDKEII